MQGTSGERGVDCLADDEVEGLACGDPMGPERAGHAESCDGCRTRVAAARASMTRAGSYLAALGQPDDADPTGNGATPSGRGPLLGVSADMVPGYRLLEEMHRGGQGVVYRAFQQRTRREVAVKMLLGGRFAGPTQRARFEREAEIVAQLKHPNIVTVHDTVAVRGERYAIVMEFVDGEPIDRWSPPETGAAGRGGPRARIRAVLALFLQVCRAVQHAHQNGVIHRDLKPSNVLVDRGGQVRVVDFGIARATRTGDQTLTAPGEFAGTLRYASPEQVLEAQESGVRADARSDVYSLGVILYELVCGRLPYDLDAVPLMDVPRTIVEGAPGPPRAANPAVDADLETLLLRALHKDPARRYGTVLALERDIERYLAGEAIEARRDSGWYVFRKAVRRHRLPIAVAASVIVLPLVGLALFQGYRAQTLQAQLEMLQRMDNLQTDALLRAGRRNAADGQVALAELVVWPEFFKTLGPPSAGDARHTAPDAPVSVPMWTLRSIYRRDPCLRTLKLPAPAAAVFVAAPGDGAATIIDRSGALHRLHIDDGRVEAAGRLRGVDAGQTAGAWTISADGRHAVALSGPDLVRWSLPSGSLAERTPLPASISATAPPGVNRDGSTAALIRADGRVVLIGLGTPGGWLTPAAWPPAAAAAFLGDRLLVLGADRLVRGWDVRSRHESGEWDLRTADTPAAAGQPTSAARGALFVCETAGLAAAAMPGGGRVILWSPFGDERQPTPRLISTNAAAPTVGFSHDGRTCIIGGTPRMLVVDTASGKTVRSLNGHAGPVSLIACVVDGGRLISAEDDGRVKVWDARPCPWPATIHAGDGPVRALRFTPEGLMMLTTDGSAYRCPVEGEAPFAPTRLSGPSAAESRVVGPWIVRNGRHLSAVAADGAAQALEAGPMLEMTAATLDAQGKHLAYATAEGVRAVDRATGRETGRVSTLSDHIVHLAWSPHGDLLAGVSAAGRLSLWVSPGLARVPGGWELGSAVRAATFVGNSGAIACGADDCQLRRIDLRSKDWPKGSLAHDGVITALAASDDGELLASAGPESIALWGIAMPGRLLERFDLPPGTRVGTLALSPDGRWLAAGCESGSTLLWDLASVDGHIRGNAEFQLARLPTRRGVIDQKAVRAWITDQTGLAPAGDPRGTP